MSFLHEAQEKLRLSEERFRVTFEQAAVGMAHLSPEGKFLRVNSLLCELFGYSREEMLAVTMSDLMTTPEDVAAGMKARLAVLTGEATNYNVERRHRKKNGEIIWINLVTSMAHTEAEDEPYFISVFVDITARKRVEESLAAGDELLRQFIQHTPAAIAMLDTEVRYMQASERWMQDYHLSGQDIIGKSHYEVFPDVPQRWREIHQRVLGGVPESCDEDCFPRADGTMEWLKWEVLPWYDADGKVGGLIFFTQVITARKKEERALQESEARFREISARLTKVLDSSLDVICVFDAEGRFVQVSAASEKIWGFRPEELLGTLYVERVFADDLAASLRAAADVMAGHSTRTFQNRYIRKDGTIVHLMWSAWWSEEEQSMFCVARDRTEARMAEEALRQKLENESTLLRQALAGEKAKGEFLAVMSHEIRTPMNGVLGFAEMLVQSPNLTPEDRELSRTIVSSGEVLLRILDDVLDFSSIEAGRLSIKRQIFPPGDFVRGIGELFARLVRGKGLEFLVAVDVNVPAAVLGDAGRIRQILLNLLGNALKFTELGSIQLQARTVAAGNTGAMLEFEVSDTGVGIPADQGEAVFEAFTQADASFSRRHGGTGLGLTISRRLAELMGGDLRMSSEVGKGTSFILRIPFGLDDLQPQASAVSLAEETHQGVEFARQYPLRILVAEDDQVSLKLVVSLLRKLGFEPLSAGNGADAVALYQQENPDCILMDVQMPGMDGLEATRKIREMESFRSLPPSFISALTANILPEHQNLCREAGMDAYLNKPIKGASIAEVLVEAWKSRGKTKTPR